ncbi:MAG: hypothetical protein KIT24_11595 [Phycisphaeraceae bacterium]|nr:hypothetical protein [Phycisphaeraceae bacterium]
MNTNRKFKGVIDEYTLEPGTPIGEGGQGIVFRGIGRRSKDRVAIKVFKISGGIEAQTHGVKLARLIEALVVERPIRGIVAPIDIVYDEQLTLASASVSPCIDMASSTRAWLMQLSPVRLAPRIAGCAKLARSLQCLHDMGLLAVDVHDDQIVWSKDDPYWVDVDSFHRASDPDGLVAVRPDCAPELRYQEDRPSFSSDCYGICLISHIVFSNGRHHAQDPASCEIDYSSPGWPQAPEHLTQADLVRLGGLDLRLYGSEVISLLRRGFSSCKDERASAGEIAQTLLDALRCTVACANPACQAELVTGPERLGFHGCWQCGQPFPDIQVSGRGASVPIKSGDIMRPIRSASLGAPIYQVSHVPGGLVVRPVSGSEVSIQNAEGLVSIPVGQTGLALIGDTISATVKGQKHDFIVS